MPPGPAIFSDEVCGIDGLGDHLRRSGTRFRPDCRARGRRASSRRRSTARRPSPATVPGPRPSYLSSASSLTRAARSAAVISGDGRELGAVRGLPGRQARRLLPSARIRPVWPISAATVRVGAAQRGQSHPRLPRNARHSIPPAGTRARADTPSAPSEARARIKTTRRFRVGSPQELISSPTEVFDSISSGGKNDGGGRAVPGRPADFFQVTRRGHPEGDRRARVGDRRGAESSWSRRAAG